MAVKSVLLAMLTLVPGQLPEDVWATNKRTFRIPIDIQPQRRQEIRQLFLYVSTDKGKSWEQYQAVPPSSNGFTFNAKQDGEYWFRAAAINRQGNQEPDNLYKGPPDQKVLVDTRGPVVRLADVNRQGSNVLVRWEIQEEMPDIDSFRVKYRAETDSPLNWRELRVPATLTGTATITNPGSSPLIVRMELKDAAGNYSYMEKKVGGEFNNAIARTNGFNASGDDQKIQNAVASQGKSAVPPPVQKETTSPVNPVPPPGSAFAKETSGSQNNKALPPEQPPQASWDSENNTPQSPLVKGAPDSQKQFASQSLRPSLEDLKKDKRALPALRFVNNEEIELRFKVSNVGNSGVSRVVLFATRDDGVTWEPIADDPSIGKEEQQGGFQQVVKRRLRLPGEGVYGFALRVWSGVGLSKPAPRPGDAPEMRVMVDLTEPDVTLHKPTPDPSRPNALLVTWKARDRNLTDLPVTLEWAETPTQGGWKTIETNLANTGTYSWQISDKMPARVYLRLKVFDKAGNIAVAVTDRPQAVDLNVPDSQILDVMPVTRNP